MSDIEVLIRIPEEDYRSFKEDEKYIRENAETESYSLDRLEVALLNGTPLPKGHFIAICESDYPITEKVENNLKETVFVGGDEEEEDMYCFDIKEIIEADKE